MENWLLTVVYSLPLIPIFYFGWPNRKKHFLLGLFTLAIALPFEVFAVSQGFWSYSAAPQVFSVSVFTLLAYLPWVIYSYFSGNAAAKILALHGSKTTLRYLFCGLFGSLYAGFLFDLVSVRLGYYEFHIQPQVFGVPWVVIITEAFCVALVIFLFEKIVLRKPPAPV